MFFNLPNEDVLRHLREEAAKQHGAGAETARIIVVDAEGVVTIDDPSLVKVVSVEPGWPSNDELDRLQILVPGFGWIPIRRHRDYGPERIDTPPTETENV